MVTVNMSIVVGAPTDMLMLLKLISAPLVEIDPSNLGRLVDVPPSSTPLALNLNQPAVPWATPTKLHVPVFDTDPLDAAPNVSPLVAEPGVNGPDASVTVPSNVPLAALSADAGCVPVLISMTPLANAAASPVVPARLVRNPVDSRSMSAP